MNAVVLEQPRELAVLPNAKRETILRFEAALRELPQTDCPLKHTFAPGMYAREILLPPETFIVGKIHKHAHLNIVTRGRCTVVTEFGTARDRCDRRAGDLHLGRGRKTRSLCARGNGVDNNPRRSIDRPRRD
jgi:hypothetical protein